MLKPVLTPRYKGAVLFFDLLSFVASSHLTWVTMWTSNIIVVTIGNIVGGLIFVGVIYWVAFRKEIAALK